ncbi:MAG: TRAP transporter substrate-binding protein DctP, partial [Pseudomonadota bacterium]
MLRTIARGAAAAGLILGAQAGTAAAEDFIISGPLGQVHFWIGEYMDNFADEVEATTDDTFTRFYAGELVSLGQGLDGLQGGVANVAIMAAPYHPGRFPLSDITQLPVYDTDSPAITRAFQKLLDSDAELKDGKTFYQYELGDKNVHGWALGATGAYAISSTGKVIDEPSDFEGMPIRAGAALQTMTLENLGVNPVTIPAAEAYEALSRGTLEGILLSVADWKSYSLQDLLKYTIDGVALGHWESYLAVSGETWDALSDEQKAAWDAAARKVMIQNAEFIEAQEAEVRENVADKGSEFVDVADMSQEMRDHISGAALQTWKTWIERLEEDGHPARAAARLWADLVKEDGGR